MSKIVFDAIIPAARTAIRYGGTIVKALFALTARTFVFLKKRFFALPPKKQLIIASIIAFSITLGGIFSWSTFVHEPPTEVPIIVADAPEETLPPTGEHNAILASPEMIAETAENIIAPIFLKDALYLVMENGIYYAEKREVFPLSSETPIRYASGMDDLNLVFLMTAEGRLFAFAPSNHSLVENVLRLPAGFRPAGIGTFLTYLYVLEEGTGKIYRFPRAEGGFGDGMLWTKTTFDTETSAIAVSENIYGMTASGIQSFFRGNVTESFSQEMPAKALSPESICASEESPEQFAVVDSRSKRVVLYGTDGHIVSQYFHESFSEASACALSGDGSSVAVGIGKQTSIIRLTNTTGQ